MAEMAKLGKKGQVSLPRSILRRVGIEGEMTLLVEAGEDGSIVLRPAGVYPLEIYSQRRIAEFEAADRMTAAEKRKLAKLRR
jgi:bifunctional DNA-binding transcriptional regulator/antitoxin component of YhaV-PrlF toxin-antitoxin module